MSGRGGAVLAMVLPDKGVIRLAAPTAPARCWADKSSYRYPMPFKPDRRNVVAGAFAGAVLGWTTPALAAAAAGSIALGPAQPFSFDRLKQRAKAMSRIAYTPAPKHPDDDALKGMTFDTFAQAVYRPDKALWRGVAGAQEVRLFPQGRFYAEPVAVHVLEGGQAREVVYTPDLFDMPPGHPLRKLKRAGFAGFRLMSRGGQSDWLAYLGASYFRASDPSDQYGASARGLAINTGRPEEFPRFTAFWLEQNPSLGNGGGLTVYALLESPSVVGAYRMDNRRLQDKAGGSGAVQEIECELYFRAPVDTVGIAPMTSMFWYGENSGATRGDWRPEVHDSDGLALWTGAGERIWRPLADPPRIITNAYADANPKGFGLIQRDRNFEDYQDDSLFYDRRPSLWVEPLSGWGRGAVNLVQLPTVSEREDNMVAFWTPQDKVVAGSTINARYRLHWGADAPVPGDVGRIVATRVGIAGKGGRDLDGRPIPAGSRKYMIDVQGKALDGVARGTAQVAVTTTRGKIDGVEAFPVVGTDRWRMMFDLSGLDGQPADLRAYLRKGSQALSET
jgi:glucans biosynthesis protein